MSKSNSPKTASKNKVSEMSSSKLSLLPVHSSQSSVYNTKELSKQFNKLLQEASKAICNLDDVTTETVQATLIQTIESVYNYALVSSEKGKKGKKNKRSKDPNAPKKPLSNYMVFCIKNRSDVQVKHPNAKPTEVSQLLGKMWNSLTTEQKAKFIDPTFSN